MSGESPEFTIRRITRADTNQDFACKTAELNEYFKRYALTNDKRGSAHTFVITNVGESKVQGYYSSAMSSVPHSVLQPHVPWKLPAYPAPVALMCRLAVARDTEGKGLGTRLLVHMFEAVAGSAIGCLGIGLDAKDPDSERFYLRRGFVCLDDLWPRRMFIAIQTVREGLASRT